MSIMSDDDFVRLFQRTFGLDEDGWSGRDTEAKVRELAELAGVIIPTIPDAEIPDDYWPMLSRIESADRPYVQATSSSASGLYPFIRSTWIGEGGAWGPTLRPTFGGLKPWPDEQLARAKSLTAKNASLLKATILETCRVTQRAGNIFRDYSGTSLPERPIWSTNALMSHVPPDLGRPPKSLISGKVRGGWRQLPTHTHIGTDRETGRLA